MEKIINVLLYVTSLLKNGTVPLMAYKFGTVHAKPAEPGQQVITWSETEDRRPLVEKIAIAKEDDMIVTKSDANGHIVSDRHGHDNQWLVNKEKFEKKYLPTTIRGVYRPAVKNQKFIRIDEPLIIEQWGSTMKLPSGSFINITNADDMYGVNPRDFWDTYIPVCYAETKLHRLAMKYKEKTKFRLAKGLYKISVCYEDVACSVAEVIGSDYPSWEEIVPNPSKYYGKYIKPYIKGVDGDSHLMYFVCEQIHKLHYRIMQLEKPAAYDNSEDIPF